MNKGLLIVFEGIDGTGKSTQMSLLATAMKKKGLAVIETREPTDGKFGRKIRELYTNRSDATPEQELELFLADRQEHVDQVLTPGLRQGKIILCDRYFLSTAAYQGAIGFSPAEIIEKNSFAPSPDLALLFYVPPKIGIERITTGRGDTLNDFEEETTLQKVAAIFDSLRLPYIQRIDASGSVESIHRMVLEAVTPLLPHLNDNE